MNISQIPQWLQTAGLVLGAVYAIATILSGLGSALAAMFPSIAFFARVGTVFGTIGADIQKILSAIGKNGGGKAMGLVLCIALATSATGCATLSSWWGGGGEQQVLTLAERVAADALKGMSVDAIAKDLGVAVIDVIRELLTSKDGKVGATPAHAEATARVGELRDAGAR